MRLTAKTLTPGTRLIEKYGEDETVWTVTEQRLSTPCVAHPGVWGKLTLTLSAPGEYDRVVYLDTIAGNYKVAR